MAIAACEFECHNCRDVFAADRYPELVLCPVCSKLDLLDHCGTCGCEVCQSDGEVSGNDRGWADRGAPWNF